MGLSPASGNSGRKLDLAATALRLIQDGPAGDPPGGGTWDLAWAQGVATSALAAIEEQDNQEGEA